MEDIIGWWEGGGVTIIHLARQKLVSTQNFMCLAGLEPTKKFSVSGWEADGGVKSNFSV